MMTALRQTLRGCRRLPHVGEHPGAAWLAGLILLGGAVGSGDGALAVAGGAAMMAAVMGPLFLFGAYQRAALSDRLQSDGADR